MIGEWQTDGRMWWRHDDERRRTAMVTPADNGSEWEWCAYTWGAVRPDTYGHEPIDNLKRAKRKASRALKSKVAA